MFFCGVNEFDKTVEQIMAVLRSWRCFRMILHGKHGPVFNAKAFDHAIEQRAMGFDNPNRQAVTVNTKSMVLGRNFDFACF